MLDHHAALLLLRKVSHCCVETVLIAPSICAWAKQPTICIIKSSACNG